MMRLLNIWNGLRGSIWPIPALMVAAAGILAFGLVYLDTGAVGEWVRSRLWVWQDGPEGARSVLTVIAGSMITVTGVVYSITIVALVLASSQYGSRLMRNFTRDFGNQITLGTFTATFFYCLIVLRSVHGAGENGFVPSLAVTVAFLSALASLGVLVYFVHHISTSIQAEHIIGRAGSTFLQTVNKVFPKKNGPPETTPREKPPDDWHHATPIRAKKTGYIQTIDYEDAVDLAVQRDMILRVDRRPGDFVLQGSELAKALGGDQTDSLDKAVLDLFSIGARRTTTQDVSYPLVQLVEIALRGLSAGVNEPFNALTAIDWIAAGLAETATRDALPDVRRDKDGRVRVQARVVTRSELIEEGFGQIRASVAQSPAVALRLLQIVEVLAPRFDDAGARAALRSQAEQIYKTSKAAFSDRIWMRQLEGGFRSAMQTCGALEHDRAGISEEAQR